MFKTLAACAIQLCLMAVSACLLQGQSQDEPIYKSQRTILHKKPIATELVVSCDMACKWSLDGKPQADISLAGAATAHVDRSSHLLIVTSMDGQDIVHKQVPISGTRTVIYIELQPVREARLHEEQQRQQKAEEQHKQEEQARLQQAEDRVRGAKQRDLAAGVWVDPATNLMWAQKDNGKHLTFQEAVNYCRDLRIGGYSDWTLPTLNDLKGIDDPASSEKVYDVESSFPDFTYYIKGHLQLSDCFQWSSSTAGSTDGHGWHYKYCANARTEAQLNYRGGHALCVRPSGR